MRKIMTVVVVLTVLLAGCSFGGSSGTPTAGTNGSAADANMDGSVNDLPGVANNEVQNSSALVTTFQEEAYSGYADLRFSVETANSDYTVRYRNDTEQQLYEASTANQSGSTVYYVTDGTAAVRNTTTGEVQYGSERFGIASQARFTLFVPQLYVGITSVLDWETAGTTTVDGEPRYVLEADSINNTATEGSNWNLSSANTTVDGRFTVGTDGIIRSGDITLSTEGDSADITFSLRKDESMNVTAPDWYDETEAEA